VRNHDTSAEVVLGMRWHSHPRTKNIAPTGLVAPGGLVVAFGQGQDAQSVNVESYRVYDAYGRVMLSRTRQPGGTYSIRMASVAGPRPSASRKGRSPRGEKAAMRRAIQKAQPEDFLFTSRGIRKAGQNIRLASGEPAFTTSIDDDRVRLYCAITDNTQWGIESILDRLHFIGPLRQEPTRVYELSGDA
jgi:hypothetical protein